HYFDRTGHRIVDPRNLPMEHLMAWRDTIADTVRYTAKLEKADPDRIGLLGFSLGAGLSLAVGAKKELKVAAIAEFFGFLHEEVEVTSMPPTLIIHGWKDTLVKVEKALELEKLLQTLGTKYEMKIYPDADHLFKANLLDPCIGDAADRTLAFFEKYLKNRGKAQPENKGQPKKLPVWRGRFSSRSSSTSGAQWPISLLPTEEMRICVAN